MESRAKLPDAFPAISSEWHPTKNGSIDVSTVSPYSAKKFWWQCSLGHEWDSIVANRTKRGDGCPYCSGRRVIPGFNDLMTKHPEVAAQWHPVLNGSLLPSTLSPTANQKAWWVCELGHSYESLIPNRTRRNDGCPVCAGKQALAGFNDLSTTFPDVAAEWHSTKNGVLLPQDVTAGRATSVWWQCSQGHEWQASVYSRARGARGCPFCSGRYVVQGKTGLAQTHPELAVEWHPTLNVKPATEVKAGSHYPAWWQCQAGHVWNTRVKERTRPTTNTKQPSNCPTCWASATSSTGEQAVASFIESLGVKVERNSRSVLKPQEVDVYVPSHKIAIEYNGIYFHSEMTGKGKDYHWEKWLSCKKQGIQLVQVWEDEWIRNPEQVKSMLAHKLGLPYGDEPKVMARKTVVTELSLETAKTFLEENHIQGFAAASYYIGLSLPDQETPVAVLALRKEGGSGGTTLNIIRYATRAVVPGGFTKLLKYAERTYQPEQFITFSDNCVSDGGLYQNNGFMADKELPPDYMYVVKNERKHKFGYRLKRFKNDPNLKWEEGLTERELASLNGLPRIWDAGKTRWVKKVLPQN